MSEYFTPDVLAVDVSAKTHWVWTPPELPSHVEGRAVAVNPIGVTKAKTLLGKAKSNFDVGRATSSYKVGRAKVEKS